MLSLFHLSSEDFDAHVKAVTLLLYSFIDWEQIVLPDEARATTTKEESVARAVELVYKGVRLLRGVEVLKKKVDGERAGVVLLRFGNRSLFEKGEGEGLMGKVGGWWGKGGKGKGGGEAKKAR